MMLSGIIVLLAGVRGDDRSREAIVIGHLFLRELDVREDTGQLEEVDN
jgi:hypothetical protein